MSGKKAAHVLEVHQSTMSRQTDGQHDSPVSRVRELLRKLTREGAFPAPIIADLLADCWRENVAGLSLDELHEKKRRLHRDEALAGATVDVWQSFDLSGEAPECEREVDEAILSQIARLLELYTVRQEIRALER